MGRSYVKTDCSTDPVGTGFMAPELEKNWRLKLIDDRGKERA
jgi:hypothetical protein